VKRAPDASQGAVIGPNRANEGVKRASICAKGANGGAKGANASRDFAKNIVFQKKLVFNSKSQYFKISFF
jgi:hypothetical protein